MSTFVRVLDGECVARTIRSFHLLCRSVLITAARRRRDFNPLPADVSVLMLGELECPQSGVNAR